MSRTLLLADDSVTIQKVVSLTFASEGVEIITANDGQEAIEKLGERTPDVALLDIFMPKRDGYEVCSYIKQDERFNNIPVILLVGAFEPFDQEKARQAGADDYLTKPFQSIRQLVTKVNDLLNPSPPPEAAPDSGAGEPVAEVVQPATFAGLEMDDQSIEVTSAVDSPDAVAPEAAWQEVDDDAMPPGAPSESEPTDMENPPVLSVAPVALEETDQLLDLGDIAVAAPVSDADDVLRIYEEIKLPQPSPAEEEVPAAAAEETMPENTTPAPLADEAAAIAGAAVAPLELSSAAIDAIARRVVELMSDRAIREIAWEVVPDMADLHIKRRLEETK
jgi:CheY-like chemotaxis protein